MTKNWIDDLLVENENVETPLSYIFWSLMFCISSAAANAYTLRTLKGNLIYYPNIYVILMGESGLGKGYPVNLAKRLLQEANITRVIAGRSSIQAIIKEGATTRSAAGKPLITDSRMAIVNGELSTAVIADPDALTILTDLYDAAYNKEWVNLLKGDGAEKLKNPYVTCLFGSSPSHFYDSIPQPNIEGGYIGRNLIIYEEHRAKNLDLLDDENESHNDDKFMNILVPKYVPHLQKIAGNSGRMIPDNSVRELFNSWRHEWRATQAKYNDRTGFVNRVPDHVLKVAMCLALAEYDNKDLVITKSHIEQSISKVTALIYATAKAAEGGGLDPLAAASKRVMDALIAAPGNQLTRTALLVRGYGDYDAQTFEKIIDTLMEMKWVKRERIIAGPASDWLYHLAGEPKANLMNFRAQRKPEP